MTVEQKKILVVDDEENVLASVKKVIHSKFPDFIIELVNDPADASEKVTNDKFDLLITDLMMPGIDGLELIKKIVEIDKEIKIIMITGYATMKTALLAEREGAQQYISKPFTRDELISTIRSILDLEENN